LGSNRCGEAPLNRGAAQTEAVQTKSVVAVVAMMVVVPLAPLGPSLALRWLCAHGEPASFAELRPLAQHARLNLPLAGDELVAKPQSIGRAGFAGRIAALGVRGAKAAKQYSNRQGQRADQSHRRHCLFLDL
jgi:hypothetical protein